MANKFATALKPVKHADLPQAADAEQQEKPSRSVSSRTGMKHIGGYFDPSVGKQLKMIAAEEDSNVQKLMEEAFDLLFQSRQKPMIARKQVQ